MAFRLSLSTPVHTFSLRSACVMAQSSQFCQSGSRLKFMSWNCRGLNHPIKRSKVLHHLQRLGGDVVYLQETHLKLSDHAKLRGRWVGQIYHSSFQGKSRGVAILIRKSINFTCSDVHSDVNGRYIIVTGRLYNTPVALVNIYGPNWDNEAFFRLVFSKLTNMSSYLPILGGDFNCWINPTLDRSSTRNAVTSKSAKIIQSFMDEFSMSDPWRRLNPSGRAYSFFSSVHHTFTRIDYFLLDNHFLSSVYSCSHDAIVISDHAPVILDIQFEGYNITRPPWRLNTRLLSSENFVNFISQQIDYFLSLNKTPDVSMSVVWEALKAYLRGEIISFSSYESKLRKKKMSEMKQRIAQLDNTYATSPSPDIFKERLSLNAEYDILASAQVEDLLLKSRSTNYEHGDKASRLLAHYLRQTASSHQIPQIKTPSGVTTDPQIINEHFRQFYISLYSSDQATDPSALDHFFSSLNIPRVDPESVRTLEEPITIAELRQAAFSMQTGKCPGPDGFPIEFYRKFFDKLAPILIDMFNESFLSTKLPTTLMQATISLILKKDKDPLLATSYRPISLLSVDLKLLSKLLAMHLESVLPSIISPDQTGFIHGRHSFSNLRRLFNILYNPSSSPTPELLISLDAEKAFDRVEWDYLFYTLQKFGFGNKFISWVRLLYTSPTASIRTNNILSAHFPLHRSTRQGCPLSPLLFAIAIEPLAVALRSHPHIRSVLRYGVKHTVSLYADDLLLYISDPSISIPAILDTLTSFGCVSGYKLNLTKSEIFPINQAARNFPLHNFPFKVALDSFVYLGIRVTTQFKELFKSNILPLVDKMQDDFARWALLNLSLAARVNAIKMNTLPKLSYLFQCLPIFIPQSFFFKIDKLISEFVWNKKTPRLRRPLLQRPKSQGGLALPNFRFYYWACNLRAVQFWLHFEGSASPPAWIVMESQSAKPASLSALVHAPVNHPISPYSKSIIVKSTVRVWRQFRRYFGLQAPSRLAPLAPNLLFHPSIIDGAFSSWQARGIKAIKDLYNDDIFSSFQQLSDKLALPKNNFFRYLQIRSFVRNVYPSFPNLPEPTALDPFLTPLPAMRGMISMLYNLIHSINPASLRTIRTLWENDLQCELADDVWDECLRLVHSSSISARHGLLQCKILHRCHLTKVRLSKIYGDVDPICDRCRQYPATYFHMFWACPSLNTFWLEIFNVISQISSVSFTPSAVTALFGITLIPAVPKCKRNQVAFVTLLARRLILMKWKSPTPPSWHVWIKDILYFINMEKIRCTLRGSSASFRKTWGPFFEYANKLTFPNIPN